MLACTDVPFMLDGCLHRQIDGTAMGSPLGCTMAVYTMSMVEDQFKDCEFRPIFHRGYVGGTFDIFHSKSDAEIFYIS